MGWSPGAGVPLTRRMIARDFARFAITIAAVGFTIVLMLFLLALYDGVRTEANGWVSSRPVDAWVAQKNTTNFIKASSFLPLAEGDSLRADPTVAEVTPLLRLITLLETAGPKATVILVGIDTASEAGLPAIAEGAPRIGERGIIVDWALSKRLRIALHDTVIVEGQPFHVTGISRGTNSVLTQLAFIGFDDARALMKVPQVASYFLVRAAPGVRPAAMIERLRARDARVSVLSQHEFAENNMDEMRAGLIPILTTVAVLGTTVALAVLTLLLYGLVLERREDYAVLKAIGAPTRVLARVIAGHALAIVLIGIMTGLLAYLVAVPIVLKLAPVVALSLSARTVAIVALGALAIGAVGALTPLRRIARIHPAEVFRA